MTGEDNRLTNITSITSPFYEKGADGQCIEHGIGSPVSTYTVEEGEDASEGAVNDYCVFAFKTDEECGGCYDNMFYVEEGES
jgi:hypothetical protein